MRELDQRNSAPERALEGLKRVDSLLDAPLSDFVGDTEARWQQIQPFLSTMLARYKNPKVLDVATGLGQDALSLTQAGYEVVANEVDDAGIQRTQRLFEAANVPLDLRRSLWQEMGQSAEYRPQEFDAVFSLGNSFPTYLLNEEDRVNSLRSFWKVLKSDGTLVFDTRNFDYMLDNAAYILKDPEKNFDYRYASTYLGRGMKGFPVEINPRKIHFIWKNQVANTWGELDIWPATEANVREMLHQAIGENVQPSIFTILSRKNPNTMILLNILSLKE